MRFMMTDKEALDFGFTHRGCYYGIPVFIGNLEFQGHEPINVTVKYRIMEPLFFLASFTEWLFTPPNAKSMFMVYGEIEASQ